MKIHVIQEAGLEQEILDQMARVLQAQQGPLSFFFYPQPVEPGASLTNDLDLAWEGSAVREERVY